MQCEQPCRVGEPAHIQLAVGVAAPPSCPERQATSRDYTADAAAAGSLILGLALGANALASGEAAALALIDDLYQAERWGGDAEAERNRRRVRSEIDDAARFMELCR